MVTILVLLVNVVWYNFCIYSPFDQLDFCINFCVSMDRLPPETQEQLKKMSNARVTAKLGRAGYDLDRLEELDRGELLEALAEAMLVEPAPESATEFDREAREASQVPLPAGDSSTATSEGGSAAVRLRELELEERRAEREERKAAREAEQRRLEVEAEERKAAREAEERREQRAMEAEREQRALEERRLELEVTREQAERDARLRAEQLKFEHEIRLEELKARQAKPGDVERVDGQTPSDPNGVGNLALQTKRFGKI